MPALDDIRHESDRMRRLLDDLLLLAADADAGSQPNKTVPIRREQVRLDEIALEAVRAAEALASGQVLSSKLRAASKFPATPTASTSS